ncbi:hypothetical protein BS50DRAFT_572514 [Corynespora cassiicola Philippines]|uniref:C6 zinc finger domain-containing protein n=1 Tax=Corynespora cassiicola Philippines TaxID=1448308 RepID=A0A2T2NVA3_CORCC|nr:hypothetical protein BS50DRAFT_572514 [Corynespora cassiicola Philippines]
MQPPSPLVEPTRMQELELMVHWMNFTCKTLSHGPPDYEIWHKTIPEDAVHHEFVMDGIFALTSLHIAFDNASKRLYYTKLAMQYQNSGIKKYQRALEEPNEGNFHALFAFSLITTILALAFPNACPGLPLFSHKESIVSLVELLQGVAAVHRACGPTFHKGRFNAFWQPLSYSNRCSDDASAALSRVRQHVDEMAKSESLTPERHKAYLQGLESLEKEFGSMHGSRHLGPILSWPANIDNELLQLFKNKDQMAEVIFMHYGVLLLHARDRWWARDIGVCLIEGLTISVCTLDPQWTCLTQWAERAAETAIEHGRLSWPVDDVSSFYGSSREPSV